MRKRKKVKKIANNPLDRFSAKRGRGRPPKIDPSWVRSSADNNRKWLEINWSKLGSLLLEARTEHEVTSAVQRGDSGNDVFLHLAPLILKALRDPKFPKRKRAQINFLADSIAGGVVVTPRRSRDICAEQRKKDTQRHMILRHEYWIECSCGYEGHSENHRCKKCGAILYISNSGSESN